MRSVPLQTSRHPAFTSSRPAQVSTDVSARVGAWLSAGGGDEAGSGNTNAWRQGGRASPRPRRRHRHGPMNDETVSTKMSVPQASVTEWRCASSYARAGPASDLLVLRATGGSGAGERPCHRESSRDGGDICRVLRCLAGAGRWQGLEAGLCGKPSRLYGRGECLIVLFVLVGIGGGERGDRPIEAVSFA